MNSKAINKLLLFVVLSERGESCGSVIWLISIKVQGLCEVGLETGHSSLISTQSGLSGQPCLAGPLETIWERRKNVRYHTRKGRYTAFVYPATKHTWTHLFLHNNALRNPNDQIIKPAAKPEKHFHPSSHFLFLLTPDKRKILMNWDNGCFSKRNSSITNPRITRLVCHAISPPTQKSAHLSQLKSTPN